MDLQDTGEQGEEDFRVLRRVVNIVEYEHGMESG